MQPFSSKHNATRTIGFHITAALNFSRSVHLPQEVDTWPTSKYDFNLLNKMFLMKTLFKIPGLCHAKVASILRWGNIPLSGRISGNRDTCTCTYTERDTYCNPRCTSNTVAQHTINARIVTSCQLWILTLALQHIPNTAKMVTNITRFAAITYFTPYMISRSLNSSNFHAYNYTCMQMDKV